MLFSSFAHQVTKKQLNKQFARNKVKVKKGQWKRLYH
jgi:hypothetical protein